MRRDGDFHTALASVTGKVVLSSIVRAIFNWMARFHARAVHTSGLEQLTLDEHEVIHATVAAGDGDAAAEGMRPYLPRADTLYRQKGAADGPSGRAVE